MHRIVEPAGSVRFLERGMEAGHGDAACAVMFPMLRDGG
jgi:hypothetical protein